MIGFMLLFLIIGVVKANEDKPLVYIGSAANLICKSNTIPIWSWYGKGTSIATNLALGDKKQARFDNSRYVIPIILL